jgi:hypothetical protein
MPDTSLITPLIFSCKGGLILDLPNFELPPGSASSLVNFEPATQGGYRRINGTDLWNTNQVSGTGKILGVKLLGSNVIACRGANVEYSGTGTGSWTSIVSNRTSAGRYDFDIFDYAGTEKIIMADGVNPAATWNGSSNVVLNGTGAPAAPAYVQAFQNHMFYLKGTTITFSAPFNEADFAPANGAGTITIDSDGVGLKSLKEELFVFSKDRVYKIVGRSSADFQLIPVTRKIGCLNGFTVQEIAGDLTFLAPDGLRTVKLTDRVGDVELGTISQNIQQRFKDVTDFSELSSTVIRNKTQYRLFYPTSIQPDNSAKGIVAVLKREGWEFSDLKGFKPSCCDSAFINDTETIIHGGYDGYVYNQEDGNTFNGTSISYEFRTPDLTMGDPGTRKNMQRLILHMATEGAVTMSIIPEYDFNSTTVPQPQAQTLLVSSVSTYGTGVYGTDTYGGFQVPFQREVLVGSGFAVAMRFYGNTSNPPFVIKGMDLEFIPGGKR